MKTIITIGRQFGSGGRDVGKILAEQYQIPFYDNELLARAAKESGFCEEMLASHDERPTNSFLYNLVMDTYTFGYNSSYIDMPISQKIFLAQFDTIKKIASEGPCVIVGRCADYALSDYPNCVNIFIHSDETHKIKRIMERHAGVNEQKAREMMQKQDKQRQSYYNYYSSKKWGRADTYDLCVNSGKLGIDGTVQLIMQFVDDFEKQSS